MRQRGIPFVLVTHGCLLARGSILGSRWSSAARGRAGPLRGLGLAAKQPESHEAYGNLGLLLLHEGRVAEALAQVRQAVELQARSAHNQRSRGIVALEAGEVDEACEAFFAARRLEPYNGANHFNVGLCEWERGRLQAARTAFDQAIELEAGLSVRVEEI